MHTRAANAAASGACGAPPLSPACRRSWGHRALRLAPTHARCPLLPRRLQAALGVRADSSSKKRDRGQRLDPAYLTTGRNLGSGSFGECYQGSLQDPQTGEARAVVLKRVKARVAGAEEMHEAEHLINVLASKAAGDAVAPFMGYALVETPVRRPARAAAACAHVWQLRAPLLLRAGGAVRRRSRGCLLRCSCPNRQPAPHPCLPQSGRLTKGLWLVWEYEGDKTLAYYLKVGWVLHEGVGVGGR